MTVTSVTNGAATTSSAAKTSLGDLNQGDFLKLMLAQMQQQDPFNPTDQTEMLAQMAQFSQLAGTSEMGDTLKTISSQLDALVTAQSAAQEAIAQLAAKVATNTVGADPANDTATTETATTETGTTETQAAA